ncbi:uncharacterized protein IWZ02DRAFT_268514 [Phyllosticta citriasiana]|uniref:uncharacterized protein n=1 Tax=Phyllosticta citriasiana TaxID=595635 RepID=UPI0030FD2E27
MVIVSTHIKFHQDKTRVFQSLSRRAIPRSSKCHEKGKRKHSTSNIQKLQPRVPKLHATSHTPNQHMASKLTSSPISAVAQVMLSVPHAGSRKADQSAGTSLSSPDRRTAKHPFGQPVFVDELEATWMLGSVEFWAEKVSSHKPGRGKGMRGAERKVVHKHMAKSDKESP